MAPSTSPSPSPSHAAAIAAAPVALLVAVLALVATAAPAAAQLVPPGPAPESLEQCIDAEMDDGVPEATATRRCVEDPDAFDRCMANEARGEASVSEALDRCVADDVAAGDDEPAETTAVPDTTDAPATTVADDASSEGDDDGSAGGVALPLVLVAVVLAAAAGAVGAALAMRPKGPAPVAAPATTGAAPTSPPTGGDDRATLVAALVEAADLVSSEALRGTLHERLAAVGVTPIVVAAGTPFDPTVHRGVQAEPTDRPELDGTVASTDRIGWSDRGTVWRPPEVVVHRAEGPS